MALNCFVLCRDGIVTPTIATFLSQARFLQSRGVFASPLQAAERHRSEAVNYWLVELRLMQECLLEVEKIVVNRPKLVVFGPEEIYFLDKGPTDPMLLSELMAKQEKGTTVLPESSESPPGDSLPLETGYWDALGKLLYVRTPKGIKRLRRKDLIVIEAQKDYLQLTTPEAKFRVLRSMKSLDGILDPTVHCRIHRSFIVLLDAIHTIDQEQLWVDGVEEPVPIGPNYKKNLLAKIEIL